MEDGHKEATDRFYAVYEPLRERYKLRSSIHSSLYRNDDALIEIWEYHGEERGKLICRVKEENTAECYRRAADTLEEYKRIREEKESGKRTDMDSGGIAC